MFLKELLESKKTFDIKSVFLILMILFLVFMGSDIIYSYLVSHHVSSDKSISYYWSFLQDSGNIKVLLSVVVASLIPLLYVLLSKSKKLLTFLLCFFLGLVLFAILSISIKDSLIGGGFIMTALNTFIIFAVMMYFIVGITSLGTYLKNRFLKLIDHNVFDIFINFGLGLAVFLLINYIFIITSLFYPVISWLIFLGLGYFTYLVRDRLRLFQDIFIGVLDSFTKILSQNKIIGYLGVFLLLSSIAYFYFGFELAYIPYPTAWDANHAYMFLPKMRAYGHGFDWSGKGLTDQVGIWHTYIAYWFSLFEPLQNFWISPDTFAIQLNFFSGILVLLFGLALFKEVVDMLYKLSKTFNKNKEALDDTDKNRIMFFYIGWFLILLWLTSGMGAFLVFVDNKTDLGVMSLITLAVYSGFVFLKKMYGVDEGIDFAKDKHSRYYIIISGFLFAMAAMSKSTAFLDIINFGTLLVWLWFGLLVGLGAFLLVIGVLMLLQVAGMKQYFESKTGLYPLIVGALSFAGGALKSILQKSYKNINYLLIWVLSILITLILFKGPYLLAYQIKITKNFNIKNYVQSLLLSSTNDKVDTHSKSNVLVASTDDVSVTTGGVTSTGTNEDKICSLGTLSLTDTSGLYTNLVKPTDTSYEEDVGRYVGYGARSFSSPWRAFLFPGDNSCFGFDKSAIVICQNSNAIANYDLHKIKELADTLDKSSEGYKLIDALLKNIDYNVDQQVNDEVKSKIVQNITDIQNFYQDKTVSTKKVCFVNDNNKNVPNDCQVTKTDRVGINEVIYTKAIFVPYKFLTIFNTTFNWSLQNNSSYYTDIGYIWLIVFFLNIFGLIYAIFKSNKVLLSMSGVSLSAWTIWFFIGGGILWYGMGILIWTMLSFIVFMYYLYDSSNKFNKNLFMLFLAILFLMGFMQMFLNMIRISSQGAGGPFAWYRQNNGKINTIDEKFDINEEVGFYGAKDVFNAQFGHYSKLVSLLNSRDPQEGAFIAGTYIRYFVNNQKNIVYDQFLLWLDEMFSDSNVCASYLRLQDKKIRYVVIDPNIGTVVMGGGNMSLFDRLFAKFNSVNNQLEKYGAFLMLADMTNKGYVKLVSSNNIGAKYGFSLSNEYLKSKFGNPNMSDIELANLRARLALMRYWANMDSFKQLTLSIMADRMMSLDFIGDIADIIGKDINESKVKIAAQTFLTQKTDPADIMKDLTQDEKMVLRQYIYYYQLYQSDKTNFTKTMSYIIDQSISSGSQIVGLEILK